MKQKLFIVSAVAAGLATALNIATTIFAENRELLIRLNTAALIFAVESIIFYLLAKATK